MYNIDKSSLTVIILTYNEEIHIERCINSLKPIANNILVIDSFSSDHTVEMARSLGAIVLQRSWVNYADQFQWGINHCEFESEWIMRMDADEFLEEDLRTELPALLDTLPEEIDGIYIKRKVYFYRKWIRFGGFYPHILLRIWRRGRGRIEQRWMDEHIILPPGSKTVLAKGHLVDDNHKGISFWINKHNQYASREAVDLLNTKYQFFLDDQGLKTIDDPQAKNKRWLKEHVYIKIPIGIRSALYFFYRYILMFGFLDGDKGFIWHFMQGFWYRLLVDIKIMEIEERSGGNIEKMKEIIRQDHGLKV